MDAFITVITAAATLALCGAAGYAAGLRLRQRRAWAYWLANAVAFTAGVAVLAAGYATGSDPLLGAGFGVLAGGVTGLKYGLGKVASLALPER